MVPTYSLVGPFRGHMSLKSSPFSPGSSCKLSTQYIIQDHMAAHFKKLMSPKAAVDSSAPKSLHTSVKYKDQQKRDRLIQALEKYKKGLVHHLPSSSFKSRSISPSQQKTNWALLENGHPLSGQSNYSRTKREQPPSASHQEFTSRTLMPVPAARKTIPNTAPCALSQNPVHSPSAHRSSASPLLQPHMSLGSHNRKEAFQNSVHKTYSGDLLDKHAIYFTDKKQCFTPRILKTSHQPFLVKCRYYNPPSRKRSSSLGRPSLKSAGINNKKKESLHRFLEDAHVRTHSAHFSQQPDENHEWWSHDSEMPLSPGLQLEELEEEYLCFLQDLTKDILIRSCYQKEALEDLFQMHIKRKRHNLDEVRGRWKTSDKWHPAVLPNISGQEHRKTQADECHSGVEAEKPFDSNTNEKNSSKPEERAGHHKPCRSFHELWGNTAGHQHSCNILLTCSGHFREHAKSLGTANYILHQLQCKPWVNRKVKKRSS